MSTSTYYNQLLGEIVADDFRAAEVFKNAGIDFCCGGRNTLDEACREKGISSDTLAQKLDALSLQPAAKGLNFKDWNLDFLADYIVNNHHKYVCKSMPELSFYTRKIASVHGAHHPELLEVAELFSQIEAELKQHLEKEEQELFPAIKRMLSDTNPADREIIRAEIERMSGEHEFAGAAMDKINEITGGYRTPSDGCSTYAVTMQYLKQFEDDLHTHIHLENNILFPKALQL